MLFNNLLVIYETKDCEKYKEEKFASQVTKTFSNVRTIHSSLQLSARFYLQKIYKARKS